MKFRSQNPSNNNLEKIQAVALTFRYESGGARDEDRLAAKALRDPGGFHGEQDANGVLCVSLLPKSRDEQ